MPTARKKLINFSDTTVYHCISRCVRRARLCGIDPLTNKNYGYRRSWVEKRLHQLQAVFAMNIIAYAIMPNHTHLLLHANIKKASQYTDREVIRRWHLLYRGTLLTQRFISGDRMSESEEESVRATAAVWRQRLTCVSWFMKSLNEYIAKKANKEDDCTGHFWESRFRSQAILDDTALLACMLYIELNPLRAGLATTPESSDFTSLQQRLKNRHSQQASSASLFNLEKSTEKLIPVSFDQYLLLIDETAKYIIHGKYAMQSDLLPIMNRLQVQTRLFLDASCTFEKTFCQIAGNVNSMQRYAQRYTRRQIKGTFCLAS